MHVDRASRHYTAADGSVRVYRRDLLRRSYRDEQGRPRKETLANLSALPEVAIEVLRKALSGTVLVEPDTTSRSSGPSVMVASPRCTRWRPSLV
jgi:hypothetical protein